MRVLTYNIWDGGINQQGGDRQENILKLLQEVRPDVLTIQEARGFSKDEFATLTDWENTLGMEGTLAPAPSGFHVALLVRPPWKIRSAAGIHRSIFTHACLRAEVESPSCKITLLAVHLNPFDPEARLSEARHLARLAAEDQPVLLLGDFNSLSSRDTLDDSVHRLSRRVLARHIMATGPTLPEKAVLDMRTVGILEWSGLVDLYRKLHPKEAGWTYPTKIGIPGESARMRLDYVFATKPLADCARTCAVVQTSISDLASDHYPLLSEFAS